MSALTRRALLSCGAGLGLAGGRLGAALAGEVEPLAESRPLRLMMVTFRGWTSSDDGFKSYFERRRIPVEIIHRDMGQRADRLPAVVEEVKELRPDLVYAWGTSVALGLVGRWDARDPARTVVEVPVVFLNVTDPVGSGLVRDLGPTGRNLAGSTFLAPLPAQIQALRGYRPVKRIAAVFNPQEDNAARIVREIAALAAGQGVSVLAHPLPLVARSPGAGPLGAGQAKPDVAAIPDVLAAAKADGAEFVYVPPDSFLSSHSALLMGAAADLALPTFAAAEGTFEDSGALMGLFARYFNIGQLAGFQAERILLRGQPVGGMPVETLRRFSLVISMKTAQRLDLYPPVLLARSAEFA